jgi:hypothetical protein
MLAAVKTNLRYWLIPLAVLFVVGVALLGW